MNATETFSVERGGVDVTFLWGEWTLIVFDAEGKEVDPIQLFLSPKIYPITLAIQSNISYNP